ncbi:hypothetical protein [Pseudidiomarina woesei]|uniref:Type IV pilus biogenesis protein PilP n=1 Tax=Pseudidiomarina woesei TaxID=1381080 RepID=A0A0K6GXV6_9GAMM|nr:hypothetical protein [Pseudidiomarina woesei]CUA83561.1 hypothetical protein Ga0061064_0671 [Pseudidiomarina woesei]
MYTLAFMLALNATTSATPSAATSTEANASLAGGVPVNPIHQLRESEIAERLAQTEAKRLQLELQIEKAKHAIAKLRSSDDKPSAIAQELIGYELLGIVTVGERSDILLQQGNQIIRLQDGVAGPMQLTANIENNWVRLQRYGRFRDLPIVQGW